MTDQATNFEYSQETRDSINFFLARPEALISSLKNNFIRAHGSHIKDTDKEVVLINFWYDYFSTKLPKKMDEIECEETSDKIPPEGNLLQNDGRTIRNDVSRSVFTKTYKDKVFKLLEKYKNTDLCYDDLYRIQKEIESLTMYFNEENIFSRSPSLIKEMSSGDQLSAKEYLMCKYKLDKRTDGRLKVVTSKDQMREKGTELLDVLTPQEKRLLDKFGHHTIEALLIHILSSLFSSENLVKVAALVDRIESAVRQNASILSNYKNYAVDINEKCDIPKKDPLRLPFGKALVEFLVERKMIQIREKDDDLSQPKIQKKKKSYYLSKSLYAECLFNPALLPVRMNLPMIYPPLEWKSTCPPEKTWLDISDLRGGYLTCNSSEIYSQYRLLSSMNINNFHIYFGLNKDQKSHDKAGKLCDIMNKLQKQAFQINKSFLDELTSNMNFYVEYGYLMPYYLTHFNMSGDSSLLREIYSKNKEVQDICTYNQLLQVMYTNIQQARYERTILLLAKAYEGYVFYLPAFLDFRGRIYRSGILHFHERDLARSLIQFADDNQYSISNESETRRKLILSLIESTSYHYRKFSTYKEAIAFHLDQRESIQNNNWWWGKNKSPRDLVYRELAKKASYDAKNPFQFLSQLQCLEDLRGFSDDKEAIRYMNSFPITKDASASAYQIMSYFMLNETMAIRTNLIQSKEKEGILDIYDFFRVELLSFLKKNLEEEVYTSISDLFSRKLVKSIYMPLIYGKTLMSTNEDLKAVLFQYITYKECMNITRLCFEFWSTKYEEMDCLIRLIRVIGWFASACDRAVLYPTEYFHTCQDYRVMVPNCIWVYDKQSQKRRKVTLRVSSDKRDSKKTEVSTFVNFIHQKDAYIAMKVVDSMTHNSPIYTVHDNFISNVQNSGKLPKIYLQTIKDLGPPLRIINEFLINNLFIPVNKNKGGYNTRPDRPIPEEVLDDYLGLNIPDHIQKDKRRRNAWDNNVCRLKTYYSKYVNNVTGGSYRWEDHQKKWEKFKKQLDGDYCIHL
ncbi:DNA-directed 5'-3' RNA polymerase [Castilleja foliolosa]|uniref:DNA-directed RNA polymerase n=1 Tax=Castilleja foliolosa TaxID=1961234 RepID=A0ABD3DXH1_9LAMI